MSTHIIVDLEMCNVPKGKNREIYGRKNELIQIGAVAVSENLEIADTFMTYVSPEFGKIDAYIEKLTNIKQSDVQGAPHTKEALEMFMNWLPEDAILVSWSDSDEHQIRKETEAKGIVIDGLEQLLDTWVDCQKTFGEKMDASYKCYKLSEALIIANIDYEDGEHDALIDAKNTAQLFVKMEQEPELTLSPYYNIVDESSYNPFAGLLANYRLAV